jgi:predicted phage-related endonuclease
MKVRLPLAGLTPEQIEKRKRGIGGSEAKIVWSGDWYDLWLRKTGQAPDIDLGKSLPAQIGIWTEPFNAAWFEREAGWPVDRSVVGRTLVHPGAEWMLYSPDGLVTIEDKKGVWQAKHTNPFGDERDIVNESYPQLQHEMEVAGLDFAILSVLYGNSKFRFWRVERDADFVAQLMEMEAEFWEHVVSRKPPSNRAAGAAVKTVDPSEFKTRDFTRDNEGADAAARWLETAEAAAKHDAAADDLKAKMDADVGFAFGHGVVAVRNRKGAVTVRAPTKKDAARMRTAPDSEAA